MGRQKGIIWCTFSLKLLLGSEVKDIHNNTIPFNFQLCFSKYFLHRLFRYQVIHVKGCRQECIPSTSKCTCPRVWSIAYIVIFTIPIPKLWSLPEPVSCGSSGSYLMLRFNLYSFLFSRVNLLTIQRFQQVIVYLHRYQPLRQRAKQLK